METVNPLHVAEHRVGTIATWPSYIIHYLFLNCPRPFIIKKVTAFFYGNGIALSLAIRLYQICNDKYTSPVAKTMSSLYLKWQRNRFKPHVSLLWCSTSAVPMDQRFDSEPNGNCGTRSDDHGLWNRWLLFSMRCRDKKQSMETAGTEVTFMDFGFIGCYVQCTTMIRKQFFFFIMWDWREHTSISKTAFMLLFLRKWHRNKLEHFVHSVWMKGKQFIYFVTCVLFFLRNWLCSKVQRIVHTVWLEGKQYITFIITTCSLLSEEPTSPYNSDIHPNLWTTRKFYSISPRDITMIHMSWVTWL